MSGMITVTIDDKEVRAVLGRIAARARSMAPLMRNLAAIMKAAVQENFIQEGRPKWKPSKRARQQGGQTLRDSGRLFRSIIDSSDDHSAQVGTNVRYAPHLHFGTKPHDIKPTGKKALFWRGAAHPVKGVHHPGLEPRPFMRLEPSDLRRIEEAARRYLEAS